MKSSDVKQRDCFIEAGRELAGADAKERFEEWFKTIAKLKPKEPAKK